MSRLWSDAVADLLPYVPGEQIALPDLLKLNTNENPYGPTTRAIDAMRAAIDEDLRLYPDGQALGLRAAIAGQQGLAIDQVFVGNGSDEVLAHVFKAFFQRAGRPLWMPDVTYSFYDTYARFFDIPVRRIALAPDFSLDVDDYLQKADPAPCGIIFANPNAPTGRALTLRQIAQIAGTWPDTTLVLDEAYVDFGGQSGVSLLADFDNIVVVRTLSKSHALAGLRVGYAMAGPALIAGLQRVKDSFNSYPLDRVALAGAEAAIRDTAWLARTSQAIIAAREALSASLVALGFEVIPSMANFVMARHPAHDAATLAAGLREQHVLVRHFRMARIAQYLRITVGTPSQCRRLMGALEALINP